MDAHSPSENTTEHTRILRVMLCVTECLAYWNAPTTDGDVSDRFIPAFEGHWFGTKSEARVRTLLGDMALRFDAYPTALAALKVWRPGPELGRWACHLHTQLADPIYRRFTGEYLPQRFSQGYAQLDRELVARWVEQTWPQRWSKVTCLKFGSNLLASAYDAGLLSQRKDPRDLTLPPRIPPLAWEYLLYVLRDVVIATPLLDSPYVRSVCPTAQTSADAFRGCRAVRLNIHGDVRNLEWTYPDVLAWAQAQTGNQRHEVTPQASGLQP